MFGVKLPAAVLWDMDGTLVDSEHYWLKSERALADQYNANWTAADGLDMVGKSLYDSSKIMQERMALPIDVYLMI